MAHHGVHRQLELFPDLASAEPVALPSADTASGIDSRAIKPVDPASVDLNTMEMELSRQASSLAGQLGLRKLARRVSVHWNRRMRTTAGRAHYDAMRIELNPGLLALPGIDGHAEVDRTLRHELAHLIAHYRTKGRRIDPHGPEWRQACGDLGIPGESRCHTLPFKTREIRRRYLYECPACGAEIPRVRKFRKVVACYACCREHSGGQYDDRFRLRSVRQKSR